jgi:hypothetical protein
LPPVYTSRRTIAVPQHAFDELGERLTKAGHGDVEHKLAADGKIDDDRTQDVLDVIERWIRETNYATVHAQIVRLRGELAVDQAQSSSPKLI